MNTTKTGKFIAELRRERGLNQTEFGDIVGATNKTVSRWETGVYMPPIDVLEIISREFDVSLNELVAGERLVQENFREKAEENLRLALGSSAFTLEERRKYFSSRWERLHAWGLAILVIAVAALVIPGYFRHSSLLIIAGAALGFVGGLVRYNLKMAYVERKAFGEDD